jgi:SAM-dependent methyltransferase
MRSHPRVFSFAALAFLLVWNYWNHWQPHHDPFDWSPDYSVKFIPSPPLRSNQRSAFFADGSSGLSCGDRMEWDPSRLSWYKAEFEQNNGALANGYPYPDEYAFSVTAPLNISQGATVLDVGCGSGYFVGLLWKHLDIRIAGIDPLPFFVEAARRAYPDGSFCRASATNMSGAQRASARIHCALLTPLASCSERVC